MNKLIGKLAPPKISVAIATIGATVSFAYLHSKDTLLGILPHAPDSYGVTPEVLETISNAVSPMSGPVADPMIFAGVAYATTMVGYNLVKAIAPKVAVMIDKFEKASDEVSMAILGAAMGAAYNIGSFTGKNDINEAVSLMENATIDIRYLVDDVISPVISNTADTIALGAIGAVGAAVISAAFYGSKGLSSRLQSRLNKR